MFSALEIISMTMNIVGAGNTQDVHCISKPQEVFLIDQHTIHPDWRNPASYPYFFHTLTPFLGRSIGLR